MPPAGGRQPAAPARSRAPPAPSPPACSARARAPVRATRGRWVIWVMACEPVRALEHQGDGVRSSTRATACARAPGRPAFGSFGSWRADCPNCPKACGHGHGSGWPLGHLGTFAIEKKSMSRFIVRRCSTPLYAYTVYRDFLNLIKTYDPNDPKPPRTPCFQARGVGQFSPRS